MDRPLIFWWGKGDEYPMSWCHIGRLGFLFGTFFYGPLFFGNRCRLDGDDDDDDEHLGEMGWLAWGGRVEELGSISIICL
jgi:hypothetical protein